MHARIGMLRALKWNVEKAYDPDRRDAHWVMMSALACIADSSRALRHVCSVTTADLKRVPLRRPTLMRSRTVFLPFLFRDGYLISKLNPAST
jgi:hypothetical protein